MGGVQDIQHLLSYESPVEPHTLDTHYFYLQYKTLGQPLLAYILLHISELIFS